MTRSVFIIWLVALALAGCDRVGGENGRNPATPDIAKPRVYPVEIKPPTIDRSNVGQTRIVPPPSIDAIQVDVLKQSDGIVDILWVVDDSGSMANQRKTLVNNFNRFLQELLSLRVDWQIGVTSTNFVDKGHLRSTTGVPPLTKIINKMTADPKAVFDAITTFPKSRTRWEQGLRMGQFAVSSPNIDPGGPNEGFLRPNAALAIIVVSDEDDSSFGTTDYFARAFQAAKGPGNESLVSFSTIAGTTPSGCTPAGEENFYGSLAEPAFRYSAVSTKTSGVVGSICDASFENTLVQIAQALNTLRRVFPLTLVPSSGSLTVKVNGLIIPQDPVNGWQYRADTNSVVFLGTFVPPPAAEIRLEYAFSKS